MSLSARFTAAVVLLVLVVLTGALATLYISQRNYMLAQDELEAKESTRRVASVCEEALASQSDVIILNYIKAWRRAPGAYRVVLLRQDGTVYLNSDMLEGDASEIGKPWTDPFSATALAVTDITGAAYQVGEKRLLRHAAPLYLYKKKFGAVSVSYDLGVLDRRMQAALAAMASRMLLSGAVALGVGLLLSFGLAMSLTRPIQEVVDGARRVGAGDFSAVIPVTRKDELGQLAFEFNLMAQRLKDLDSMKDRFLHSVSHEMRAPLSVVASAIYHARRVSEGLSAKGLQDDIRQIESSVDRLTGFVNNILDLARLQAHRTTFEFAQVEPGLILREAHAAFTRRAEEYQLRFEVEGVDGLRPVRADAARLQQVLSNLVLNAFKYTPNDGRVAVGARGGKDGVTFLVTDSGPGIPAAKQANLFLRFGVSEAAPNPRRLPSSGLGLSICREIVEAHGGRIWTESKEGRGSAFLFTIPYDAARNGVPA